MRIRTIKPAFWANEKMAALPDFARLLAIGLLNYADDHGYFWANCLMIRGSLFPFEEDSTKVRRGLAQLESEGYVTLGKTADGREVGRVVNFSKHQRVDKPQDSEIKPLAIFQDDSKNGRGSFVDDSALYRKGKEGKGTYPPEPVGSEENGSKTKQTEPPKEPTEGDRFVEWFLKLLLETGSPPIKLSPNSRETWADCYDKLLRIDGATKEQIKEVCRWARNDSFWRRNFMSPAKLREKKDGVSYFDQFLNKMKNGGSSPIQSVAAVSSEPDNLRFLT